ncbi:transporter substrate-binding domain-containing protein [Rhodophyticola sp. CCM32]|uniref:substrate-binding periplasmic protein n=1 Tax=Rhodophyticola sp. CCM32 TaxID=2916397 RepID=UPI00107F2056|nr:transporter substrate-binding domain-containing protein [Rhodophyticola sp. CCM32]QBY00217.1 transporter substrate-binding domain-containing protein [Rhodophyticola sp. CCM32]
MTILRNLKSFVAAIAVSTIALGGAAVAQESENLWQDVQERGTLRVGVAEAPPLMVRDPASGEWSGYFLDVMEGFAASIDVEVEIVETTWGNMVAGVQAGRWDISSGLNRNPQRALALNYSIPIWSYEIGLLYDTRNPKISADMTALADFDVEGMTIAVMQGAAGDLSITPQIENANIVRLDGANEGRLAIIANRADVFATDSDIHRFTIAQNPDWAAQVLPNPAIAKQGIAFGLRNSVPLEDIQVLDIYLEEMVATGAVQRLYEAAAAAMVE